ncbi:Y-family DNA polymerase [Paenimyroides tangerinum]|uniref:Y-family DNA polymerase n=1 Tax=Paenimyroides tangerinum TaxID=2488728 RepID=A0A3P3W9Q8_9FLAO|nr:Y-family DNA polymerase [Paenimyroides tangerinum]RRJ91875.1 Y-family DNA polymerase [Paenimyroides tangerinum]
MFALLDCNNFYASCERVFQPHLNGKPICVLSNNDGCVIARSEEAKTCGIPMGAVAFEYEEAFKQHQIQLFSANFILYGDLSNRIMNIIRRYCNDVEVYSIDEAFMDFSSYQNIDLKKHCENLRAFVKQGIGIPTSIGIAPTKTLSKIANRIAKKYPTQTNHVYVLDSDEKIQKALKWMKIGDVWGIGRQLEKRFLAKGIKTAWEFSQLPESLVRKEMGVVGVRMLYELRGIPQLDLELPKTRKNIGVSRTFAKVCKTQEELEERIATFAVHGSEKLRSQKSCASLLTVFIRTNTKKEGQQQYVNQFTVSLPTPTNSAIEWSKAAKLALSKIYLDGFLYKKAGIVIGGIVPETDRQMDLFTEDQYIKHRPIMKVMDILNKKYRDNKIRLGSQSLGETWVMKRAYLSKSYTTDIKDLINVKV